MKQKVVSPGAALYTAFGSSVALRGDTLVVGAPKSDGTFKHTGSVHVLGRHDGSFRFEQKLEAPDSEPGAYFGQTVVMDGDTLLVGAPRAEAVYVFVRRDGSFRFAQKLGPAPPCGRGFFGFSLTLRGDTAAVGEPGSYAHLGCAHVFVRRDGSFALQKEIIPEQRRRGAQGGEDDFLNFGYAVSIDDRSLLVGAHYYIDYSGAGLVYAYTREQDGWTERQVLQVSDRDSSDGFGRSLARSNETLLVSSDSAIYVFGLGKDGWVERQRIALSLPLDVALAGDDLAIVLGGHVLQRRDGAFGVVQRVDPTNQTRLDLDAWQVGGREMFAPKAVAADADTLVLAAPSDAGRGAVFVMAPEP